ncbi:MAG: waaF [Deltaproteobacteria bacterium]|nr:waaF [Deltaproteobacteria bacterium]
MRYLIAQTSFLGDVVLSTPVFAALRRHDPAAHITVLVRPEVAGILEGHPHVDAVLTDDKRGRDGGFGSWRVVRKLRAGRFDVALALHKSFRTAWVLAAAGIGQRIGFRQSAGWFLYHRRVDRNPARHDVERNLSILAGLGVDPDQRPARPYLACPPDAVRRVHAALRQRGIDPATPLVGLAPGSAWATKRWTVDGYAALLDALQRDLGATAVLLGAPGDAAYAEQVQRAAGGAGVNLVGRTDLGMLVAAIDQCVVLVANDSAPVHIAVARDTPVVAIFGPTVPRQGFGPYTARARVVERALPCRPCGRHGGARCPLGTHACMRDITVADVHRAVGELLSQCAGSEARGQLRAGQ